MLHDNGTTDNLQAHSGCPSRHTQRAAEYQSPRSPVRTYRGQATRPDSEPFGALWLLLSILTVGFAGEWNYQAARGMLDTQGIGNEVHRGTQRHAPSREGIGLFGDGQTIREAWSRNLRR